LPTGVREVRSLALDCEVNANQPEFPRHFAPAELRSTGVECEDSGCILNSLHLSASARSATLKTDRLEVRIFTKYRF